MTFSPTVEWLSYRDLSLWLNIPEGTLRNWKYRGEGPPSTKVGGLVRFRRADVEAWLADNSARTS